jgi:predicted phosphodiesterase
MVDDKYRMLKDYLERFDDENLSARELAEVILEKDQRWSKKTLMNGIYALKADPSLAVEPPDPETISHNISLAKKTQKALDSNRIERKAVREHLRKDNAIEELTNTFTGIIEKHKFDKITTKHPAGKLADNVGIFQFTDAHFNELVDVPGNEYSFEIASARCKKYVDEAKVYFNANGVKKVLVALTGDLLNSSRRYDEVLSQATNRASAMYVAVELISQMLIDLNKDYDIDVASVIGNESRVTENIHWTETGASENYDIMIYNTLKILFKNSQGVSFLDGNIFEQVVDIMGQKVLLMHGHSKSMHSSGGVQKIIGKFTRQGIHVDFVIFGHIHEAYISDRFARSASLAGDNSYSSQSLQLAGRASQNIHIISKESINSIKIDLQNTGNTSGYDITYALEQYNAKSWSKAHRETKIITITQ